MVDRRGTNVIRGQLLRPLLTSVMVLCLNSGNFLCMYNENLDTAPNKIEFCFMFSITMIKSCRIHIYIFFFVASTSNLIILLRIQKKILLLFLYLL